MKILVTGGAGFIGSHLVDALIEKGHDVHVIDDLSTGKEENLNPKAKFLQSRIQNVQIESCTGFDVVFHVAAMARIQPSIKKPLAYDRANTHGTLVALEIARRCKAKFIFSSSSSVYGFQDRYPVIETDKPNPQNPYALQKLFGEMYVDLYMNLYGLRTTMFRYFNVYGERQLTEGAYATVIGIFEKQFAEGKPFTIVGDGEQRRDFTYVKDVVAANILAMENEMTDGQLYNVGTGRNVSINDIANGISKNHERQMGIQRQAEVKQTLADPSELQKVGWEATTDVLSWLRIRHPENV